MSVVHRPTVWRAAVLSAGLTFVLYVVVNLIGPSLVDLAGADAAHTVALVLGIAVRLGAGRLAARPTWEAGADLGQVLVSVTLGGVVGWLVFPGAISVLGLVSQGVPLADSVRLGIDLLLWLVVVCVGAGGARWSLPATGRRRERV